MKLTDLLGGWMLSRALGAGQAPTPPSRRPEPPPKRPRLRPIRPEQPPTPIILPPGSYRVIDGDTLAVKAGAYAFDRGSAQRGMVASREQWTATEEFRIRFRTLNAPEIPHVKLGISEPPKHIWGDAWEAEYHRRLGHEPGLLSRDLMREITAQRTLVIEPMGSDRHGRLVGDVRTSDGWYVENAMIRMQGASVLSGERLPDDRVPLPRAFQSPPASRKSIHDPFYPDGEPERIIDTPGLHDPLP